MAYANDNYSSLIECTLLDALNYHPLAPRLTRRRLQLRKFYHSFLFQLFFKGAPLLMLILLPFFENQQSFSWSSDYQGEEENSGDNGDNKSYFWTSIALEVLFLSIVTIDAVFRWYMLFPSQKSDRKIKDLYVKIDYYAADLRLNIIYIIALFITWSLLFTSIAKNGYTDQLTFITFFRQLVRPIFLIAQVEQIRKSIKAIFITFSQLFSVNILLILVIFLFAMIGLIIFPRHLNYLNNGTTTINITVILDTFTVEEGDTYFNYLSQAYWNLLVYLTTANSPDILTPAYKHNRAYFLYFGTYFFITNYFLLKVIVALYAAKFLSFFKNSMLKSYKQRLTNLRVAFALIANENGVNYDNFNDETKIKLNDVKHYTIKVNLVSDYDEFYEIVNNFYRNNNYVNYKIDWNDFKNLLLKIFEYPQPVSDNLARGDKNAFYCSYLIMRLYVALTSLPLAIIYIAVLTVLMVSDFENSLTNPHSSLAKALLAFSCVFIPEVVVRIGLVIAEIVQLCYRRDQLCTKTKKLCLNFMEWFFKGHRNKFSPELKYCLSVIVSIIDILILFIIISLGFVHVPCLEGGTFDNCLSKSNLFRLVQVTITLVLLRLLRMITMNRMFATVIHTLLHTLVLLSPFILLAYLLYYEFAVLGMTIFGNNNFIDGDAMTRCGSYEYLYYYPYNFEDFSSSMVTLWNLMIVNNWHIIVDAYVRHTTTAATIYFVIWWLITETVVNGVLYGVLIEIALKAIENFWGNSDEFKNASLCKQIGMALKHYRWFKIDDRPFYSLINSSNIHGVINFSIEEEDKKEINNNVIETTKNNPDLVAKLRRSIAEGDHIA